MSILDDFNKAQNKLRAKKKENAILEDFYAEQKKIQSEKKEKPLYTGKTDALYEDDGDIAPITTTTKKDEERKWFQKGEFDDGYQLGDITKTSWQVCLAWAKRPWMQVRILSAVWAVCLATMT